MQIARLPPEERPRERLRQHGVTALADAELLALVLGSGSPGASALDLGRRDSVGRDADSRRDELPSITMSNGASGARSRPVSQPFSRSPAGCAPEHRAVASRYAIHARLWDT